LSVPPFAAEVTLFVSNQYLRTSGAPNVYIDTFSATASEGRLIVKNGSWNGKKRIVDAIRSASIFVNGNKIFSPRDFKKRVYILEKHVNLLEEENTISIKLAGRPGSYLTLEVMGEEVPVKTNLPTTKGTLTGDETWSGEV